MVGCHSTGVSDDSGRDARLVTQPRAAESRWLLQAAQLGSHLALDSAYTSITIAHVACAHSPVRQCMYVTAHDYMAVAPSRQRRSCECPS
jgi:hypothetical protein